jgi:hypothetical protein
MATSTRTPVDPQCGTMPIIKQIMALDASATFPGIMVPASATSSLALGSRGDRVTQLQNALKERGYAVGDVDGIYGTVTQAAVTAFQRDAHLQVTGIADASTFAALTAPVVVNGGPAQLPLQPADILRILLGELAKQVARTNAAQSSGQPSASGARIDILQQILRAMMGAGPAPAPAGAGATPQTPPAIALTPIDKMLGGSALAGKKTALAIVAYVVVAILQAVGVIGAGTPAGIIINTIIAAFGGLGIVSKMDRAIQSLGVIAAKPPI